RHRAGPCPGRLCRGAGQRGAVPQAPRRRPHAGARHRHAPPAPASAVPGTAPLSPGPRRPDGRTDRAGRPHLRIDRRPDRRRGPAGPGPRRPGRRLGRRRLRDDHGVELQLPAAPTRDRDRTRRSQGEPPPRNLGGPAHLGGLTTPLAAPTISGTRLFDESRPGGPMADVRLDNVSGVHTDGTLAVADLSLHARDAELLAILGPSGCGKSTVLRMIAGIEPVTSGRIHIGGEDVTNVPPHLRNVAMVFEGNALYPHLTARANMRFGLDLRHLPEDEIDQRVGAESRVLGLGRLLDRLPKTLSAGQRQRVAVGRGTLRLPRAVLLDEPLTPP